MIKVIILICIFLPANLFAQGFENYKKGDGAKYYMKMQDNPDFEISIYVADVKKESISVEFFIYAQNTLIPIKLYQQFLLAKKTDGSLIIKEGYIQGPDQKYPQKMSSESFSNNKGVELNDFLFSDEKTLTTALVETATLKTPAGTLSTNHYRKSHNNQTVDFWIAKEAKPLGLVKLVSTGPKNSNQNYELELISLLKNVKATINPKEAKEMDAKEKALINTPLKWW